MTQVYPYTVAISTDRPHLERLASALDFASNLGYPRPGAVPGAAVSMPPEVYAAVRADPRYSALRDAWPALVADDALCPLCFTFTSEAGALFAEAKR